jgi:hypothetical protein
MIIGKYVWPLRNFFGHWGMFFGHWGIFGHSEMCLAIGGIVWQLGNLMIGHWESCLAIGEILDWPLGIMYFIMLTNKHIPNNSS